MLPLLQQTTRYDVLREIVLLLGAILTPIAIAGTAIWQRRDAREVAKVVKEDVVEAAAVLTEKVEEGNKIGLETKHEVNSRTDAMLARIESLEQQLREAKKADAEPNS